MYAQNQTEPYTTAMTSLLKDVYKDLLGYDVSSATPTDGGSIKMDAAPFDLMPTLWAPPLNDDVRCSLSRHARHSPDNPYVNRCNDIVLLHKKYHTNPLGLGNHNH